MERSRPHPGQPLAYTLVYAVESPRGPVLIDAGWHHEDAWTALRDGLGTFGIDVADVHGVVVTHFHPDHSGLAAASGRRPAPGSPCTTRTPASSGSSTRSARAAAARSS